MNMTKICIYLTSIILASVPLLVKASPQIAPNPNYSTITVGSPAENSEDFYNYGVLSIDTSGTLVNNLNSILRNYGSLGNSGSLENLFGGTLNNSGALDNFGNLGNSGKLSNLGFLNNAISGILNNLSSGELGNSGRLENSGNLNNSGNLSNAGSLSNKGTLNNSGFLSNSNFLDNSGSLQNNLGGSLNNSGDLVNDGSLSNFGNLSNSGLLRIVSFVPSYPRGTLDNFGYLHNSALGALHLEVTVLNNNVGGILDNYGVITSWSGGINNWGTLNNFGTLSDPYGGDIKNFGTLNNSGSIGFYIGSLSNSGVLNNSGSLNIYRSPEGIRNSGILNNSGNMGLMDVSLVNSATLINSGSMDFSFFKSAGGLLNNDKVINRGTLSFDFINSLHNNGTLINSGILNNDTGSLFFDFYNTWSSNNGILINSGTLNNAGKLENNGALITSGVLNNAGTIFGSGTYTQSGGKTINNGSLSQESIQIVGGSLSGTGTITGDVIIGSGASVNPGNSPGTLTINGDFHSSGNFVFEIAGLNSGQYDVLDINGYAYFTGGNIEFNFIDGFHASSGNHWDFLFANTDYLFIDTIRGWNTLQYTFTGLDTGLGIRLDGFSDHLSITVVAVPEPETYAMLLAGLGLLGFAARRRKESAV